ncbi:hypothetical protein RJT34_33171 [Clitoria ternatea]|uniref:Uncharacterized protein n=1 Tax=Clitoria ternatea TaxID=43366 RepID=A0AAN9EYA9_CLITE
MGTNKEERGGSGVTYQEMVEDGGKDIRNIPVDPIYKLIAENTKSNNMAIKKQHTVIPPHIRAEAISTIRDIDIRWSGPITQKEMEYVEQYVLAKYPEYAGLIEGDRNEIQAQNKVLKHFGLPDDEYRVLFTLSYKDAMMLVGESYPFVKGNYYMTILVSEAHRSYWHVLLDASAALVVAKDRLHLGLHRPDFLICCLDNTHSNPSRITCLLVRKKSFYTSTASSQVNG